MCPDCNEPMVVYELEGVEVDRCLKCGGTWLDSGELEMLGQRADAEPGALTEAALDRRGRKRGARRCPRCRRKLEIVEVWAGKQLILIDACPIGDGLWFDRGELKALLEAHAEGETSAAADFFRDVFRRDLDEATPEKGETP